MSCPRCGRQGKRVFQGYCSKVHHELEKKPKTLLLNCATCGIRVVRTPSQVKEGAKVYCARCPKNKGETHPKWKEGQYINPAGYRLVLHKNEYWLEHRLTWEQRNRACILPNAGGIIHHINFRKTDNRPQNLVLLSNKVHGKIHRLIDAGKWNEAKCLLIQHLEQQAFFLLQSRYLDHIRRSSLQDILN